ncbi:hypothetical protein EO238_27955, partial [Citrobacter sp. AAK_AS5]
KPYVYGSKITGAGGGGCVFSFLDARQQKKVLRIAAACNMNAFQAGLSERGALVNGESL